MKIIMRQRNGDSYYLNLVDGWSFSSRFDYYEMNEHTVQTHIAAKIL